MNTDFLMLVGGGGLFILYHWVNERDYTPIEEYLTEDYVYHGLGGMMSKTPQGFMEAIKGFHAAIPDLKSEIIDMVGEGDRLVLRFNFTGTHQGEFLGFFDKGFLFFHLFVFGWHCFFPFYSGYST